MFVVEKLIIWIKYLSDSNHNQITKNFKRFFFSSRRRHTILVSYWSSDVCSSDLDWTLYQHDFKIYTAEREAIDKLRNWVLKTTSEHLIRTACDPKDTIRDWYTKLKEQVGV